MSKQLQLGRVKWYDAKEGYGFISWLTAATISG